MQKITQAGEYFMTLVQQQLARVERMKNAKEATDYTKKECIVIGICPGDGIGPTIVAEAKKVLTALLHQDILKGKIILKEIQGLTIENRLHTQQAIPDEVLSDLKNCDVLLKGPLTTPSKGKGPNIESANVAMRRELDLFANVRPVTLPDEGIDWTFFRENTEGEYVLGSQGIAVDNNLSFDFRVITTDGTKRIARAAFEFARKNGKKHVAIVTKANILKKTDGKFLEICYEVAKEYPEIQVDDWFIDIMTANLLNPELRQNYQVFILPNLYGDILTDEAAQIQGGVGTAGSANLGNHYAMFEAIHGSAPRMVEAGDTCFANPASILKATELLLRHIGYVTQADNLAKAIQLATYSLNMTGTKGGDTAENFGDAVITYLN
jgi:isocitrate dehydrogenase (NAD+)